MDLNNATTWSPPMIPRSTDSGYNIGVLKLNETTTMKSYYFKMTMTSAMLAGAPAFIMMDSRSSYSTGSGLPTTFGAEATIYAVSPNNLTTTTQIFCPTVYSSTSPRYAGATITNSMVYNNTLYLKLNTKSTYIGDGSVGVSAYY